MDGKRLKELLANKGIKQVDVASALGISAQSMYHMFANKDIKASVLEKLCKTFDIDMNYFFPEFCVSGESYMVRINFYEALCELREKRIKELEEEVAQLKMEKTKIG